MYRLLSCLVAMMTVSGSALAQNAPDPSKVLADFRADLQAVRSDVLAKNISLTAAEAAKFWPLYEKFQAEQSVIMDAQLKGTQAFAEAYEKLDAAAALKYLDVLLTRDEAMAALRRKWLPEFQKVVSATAAARVIQIDRRLSQALQVQLSSQIPLVR